MVRIRKIIGALSKKERIFLAVAAVIFVVSSLGRFSLAVEEKSQFVPVEGGSYAEGLIGQPATINPVISTGPVDEDINALVFGRLSDFIADLQVSEDNRIYTVKLEEGLKWDDGSPLTTDDVVFTVKTIKEQESRSPLAKSWQGIIVQRVSELQIKFILPAPYVFFGKNLERLSIIPKHIWDRIPVDNMKLAAYNLKPVGSGPYKFNDLKLRKDGFITEYHLVANENYHLDKPYISDFYLRFYENKEELLRAYRLREINGFGQLSVPDTTVNDVNGGTTEKITIPRYYAVFFNQVINPLLKDKDLRTALAIAIPKDKIIREVTAGEGKNIAGPLIRELAGLPATDQTNSYDPERAKQLIDAIKPKAENGKIAFNLIVPQIDFLEKTAALIKESWSSIGVETNVIVLNPGDMAEQVVKTRNYEMVLFGNILENPADLFPFWHSSQRFYPGLNLSVYQNADVDKLIETVRQTNDESKRKDLLERADDLISADQPAIFLFSLPYYYIHTDRLEGFKNDPIVVPADRFNGVNKWNLIRARVWK
jgi:peptide/nickel transport system substrate-binding protein